MTHYLGAPPSSDGGAELSAEAWNEQVDTFDVAGLVRQLASTGTKYLLFTVGQNSGHYCAPNATYDRLVGIQPSKCSRRDLIADLAQALQPHGIRLLAYLPSGAPAADQVARRKLQWRWGAPGGWQLPGEPVGGRLGRVPAELGGDLPRLVAALGPAGLRLVDRRLLFRRRDVSPSRRAELRKLRASAQGRQSRRAGGVQSWRQGAGRLSHAG